MAAFWSGGAIAGGHPSWGTPEAPSAAVEDFAAYFDLCSAEEGLDRAIGIVAEALAGNPEFSRRAA